MKEYLLEVGDGVLSTVGEVININLQEKHDIKVYSTRSFIKINIKINL